MAKMQLLLRVDLSFFLNILLTVSSSVSSEFPLLNILQTKMFLSENVLQLQFYSTLLITSKINLT